MNPRAWQRTRRVAAAFVARTLAAAVAVVLLVALIRGGGRYFYCPSMQAVSATSCCAASASPKAHPHEAPVVAVAEDCCSARRLGVLAPAPVPPPPGALVSPVVGVLDPVAFRGGARACRHAGTLRSSRSCRSEGRARAARPADGLSLLIS